MNYKKLELKGLLLLEPNVYRDNRGFFLETFRQSMAEEREKGLRFVQDNFSHSEKGVIRGLHYQIGESAQQKLVMVHYGEILDVAVDLRRNSPTFGRHVSVHLTAKTPKILWIPEGFAHGFSVLSNEAGVAYKCSSYYHPARERGVRWNDPDLQIDWGVANPQLSEKDREQPLLKQIPEQELF